MRIQARAIRKAGELLQQIQANAGGRPSKTQEGDHLSFTRTDAASEAGLSEHQRPVHELNSGGRPPEFWMARHGANQNISDGADTKVVTRTDQLPEGDHRKSSRESAAREAGLSHHQQHQALRLANIPNDEFEQAIESDRPR